MSQPAPTLRDTNLDKLGGGTFDVLIIGGGINGAVCAAGARGARREGRADRPRRLRRRSPARSRRTSPGAASSTWRRSSSALVRKLCRVAQPPDPQPTRRRCRRSASSRRIERGFRHGRCASSCSGTWLYWLIGNFFTQRAAPALARATIAREEPIVDTRRLRRRLRVLRRVPARQRRALRLQLRPRARSTTAASPPTTSSRSGATRDADGAVGDARARRASPGASSTHPLARADQRLRPLRRRARTSARASRPTHHHVFSKGIHLIVDRLTPSTARAHVLRRRRPALLRHPDGPAAPASAPPTRASSDPSRRRDAPRTAASSSTTSTSACACAQPLTEADIIAERCGVRPLAVAAAAATATRDWLQLSRKHAVEIDAQRGARQHLRRQAHRLPQRGRGDLRRRARRSASRCRIADARWYGEPPDEVRDEFFHQARLMDLDAHDLAAARREPLSTRLWRRYGARGAAGCSRTSAPTRAWPRC